MACRASFAYGPSPADTFVSQHHRAVKPRARVVIATVPMLRVVIVAAIVARVAITSIALAGVYTIARVDS